MKLKSLKKDSKNDHFDESLRSRLNLIQIHLIIKKDKFIKQFDLSIFIDNKKLL